MEQNYTGENILDIKRFPEKAFSFYNSRFFPSQIVILLLLQKYERKEGRQADQTLLDDIVPVIRNLQKMNYVLLIYFNH